MAKIITEYSESEIKDLIKASVAEALGELKQPTAVPQKEILSIAEACELLNLAKQTIYTHTSKGTLPHFKRGKKLYFRRSELLAWIENGKQTTVADEQQKMNEYFQQKGKKL